MRSLRPLATLKTDSPEASLPEYTRKNASWPTYGSVMILNTSAENGSLSAALRVDDLLGSSIACPSTGGTSSGDGR